MCPDTSKRNGSVFTIEEPRKSSGADYDEAVAATGYGLFNVVLFLAALPIAWTCIIDPSTTGFIVNSSQCDFELTMLRRGIAVSVIFIGMILAGPLWDFVLQDCIIDSIGKRNVIVIGILLDAMCNILWTSATSFYAFILFKFISGMLIAGPLSVVMGYVAEFHAPSYQPKFARWAGLLVMISNIVAPGMAATLLLRADWLNFTIYNHFFPTWRVYLLVCSVPSILGLLTACFLPHSPKYLIAQGKNEEALRLFQTMHRWNNLRSSDQFPITEIVRKEKFLGKANDSKNKLQDSISKLRTLFSGSNTKNIVVLLFLNFSGMIAFNVMRLWVPPLWVIMNNFRMYVQPYYPADEYITMCEMIFPRIKKVDLHSCTLTLPTTESAVYVNSTTIASSCVAFGFLFIVLANTRIRRIVLMVFAFLVSAAGCFGANWALEIPYMLILVAFVIVASRVACNTILSYNADVTPKLLRPTALNVINFFGNLGAAGGNMLFAVILDIDCLSAFLAVGCVALVSIVLPLFLLGKTEENLKENVEKY